MNDWEKQLLYWKTVQINFLKMPFWQTILPVNQRRRPSIFWENWGGDRCCGRSIRLIAVVFPVWIKSLILK